MSADGAPSTPDPQSSSQPLASDAADLQTSIQHLIAETVRRSEAASAGELTALRQVLAETLTEIETHQQALSNLAERLRTVIAEPKESPRLEPAPSEPVAQATSAPIENIADPEPEPVEVTDRGPHELDIIAHGATLSHASGLQSLLRAMPAAQSVQTRQYVNRELRLNVQMQNALDMASVQAWLHEHDGRVTTTTDRVIEISFSAN